VVDAPTELVRRAQARARPGSTTLIAVTGAVAVGKSTLCAEFAAGLDAAGASAAVVSTDGFLYPYAELEARGLMMRKGFPDSYDVPALQAFVAAAREGASDLSAPIYSHETYDVVPEFSLNGQYLYFQSGRDGFRCIWAQRLDAKNKKPLGSPFAVQHFHNA
jgi:pantothenate kinase